METIKVCDFEGVDVAQGLIFLDKKTYNIQNIIDVEDVVFPPRRSIYRILIFGGLGCMFYKGWVFVCGLGSVMLGVILWVFIRPKHGVLVRTVPNYEQLFMCKSFEEVEKICLAVKSARYWQQNLQK